MKLNTFKPILLHLAILTGFIIMSFAYFSPILTGKELPQMDKIHAEGTMKELIDFEKNNKGEESQWTNSMFGGMPAYQIKGGETNNIFLTLNRLIRLGLPFTTVAVLFLYLTGFYFLLVSMKFNRWLSVLGAIAFAFASYNFIVLAAGHITKTYAIAIFPFVIAGILLIFRKKYLPGALVSTLALGIQIASNHVQITYYLAITIFLFLIGELIYALRQKELKHFLKSLSILSIASIFALLPNITNLWTTYEYGKYSIRGASELSQKEGEKKSSGLDKDYALDFSYGKLETFTILVPNFTGGGSGTGLSKKSEIYTFLTQQGVDTRNAQAIVENLPTYWGELRFTSGPVYFGAIICFLFIFSLFIVKEKYKWWLLSITILSLMLAWGKNFMPLTDLFFYYFPLYNKFRVVSMFLVVTNFSILLLAMLALREIIENRIEKANIMRALKYSFAITAGLLLIFIALAGSLFDMYVETDIYILQRMGFPADMAKQVSEMLPAGRAELLSNDAFRSLIFIALASIFIWAFIAEKINKNLLIASLLVLTLIDLWSVDKRYLNNKNFVPKKQIEATFTKSKADEFILKDSDISYRVLNLENPFNDGYTPYFHKSIGGYHGAKLRRYQELIETHLSSNITNIQQGFENNPTMQKFDSIFANQNIINMLNTRYIIYKPEEIPLINMHTLGNAWFVYDYRIVENADQELEALKNLNPAVTAVINKQFAHLLTTIPRYVNDTLTVSQIKLIDYKPNNLIYQSNVKQPQLAVFSEIFYEKGWQAYIDDKPVEHLRVNYILRALPVPEGKHKIEFKFVPNSYFTGKTVALASSIIIIILSLGIIAKIMLDFMKEGKKNESQIVENK